MAVAGRSPLSWRDLAPAFARMIGDLAGQGFRGPFAAADGRVVHNAGGSEAQELAFALAVALAYLRALEAVGIALEKARRMIFFRLTADADQFLTVAKLRALRKLWARIEQACGLAPAAVFVSAETAWRTMTQRDPYVNMLRATVAAFSAGVGGADAVSVLPFTAALGLPDRFARRIARNTQLLLIEEASLARVADPAAGSGGIEDLTDKLCHAAWALLQDVERAGGAAEALAGGLIHRHVAAVRAQRRDAVARRKDALTGTSEFPDLNEAPVAVASLSPSPLVGEARGGGSRGEINETPRSQDPTTPNPSPQGGGEFAEQEARIAFEPLAALRLAAPFETLRDASDRMLARSGARPKVFLANLGSLADFTARATFAANFFAAGGIAAVTFVYPLSSPLPDGERSAAQRPGEGDPISPQGPDPSPGVPSPMAADHPLPMGEEKTAPLVAAFKASGAVLACLCGSDKVYARDAAASASALKAAGARHIYLAGRPGEREANDRAAGVQTFIYAGCDALATLQAAHDILRVNES
jgi:methylmalonyl-CoA mutase